MSCRNRAPITNPPKQNFVIPDLIWEYGGVGCAVDASIKGGKALVIVLNGAHDRSIENPRADAPTANFNIDE